MKKYLLVAFFLLTTINATGNTLDVALKAYDEGDYDRSFQAMQDAALKGDVTAQFNIGALKELGIFGTSSAEGPDYRWAAGWYDKAARQDHPEAQYRLALLYFNGAGVTQDKVWAERLMTRAAEQGFVAAKSWLDLPADSRPNYGPPIKPQRSGYPESRNRTWPSETDLSRWSQKRKGVTPAIQHYTAEQLAQFDKIDDEYYRAFNKSNYCHAAKLALGLPNHLQKERYTAALINCGSGTLEEISHAINLIRDDSKYEYKLHRLKELQEAATNPERFFTPTEQKQPYVYTGWRFQAQGNAYKQAAPSAASQRNNFRNYLEQRINGRTNKSYDSNSYYN